MTARSLFWVPVFVRFLLVWCAGFAGWYLWNLAAGLAISLGVLTILVIIQLRHMYQLSLWLDKPEEVRLGDGWGAWTEIFAKLYRLRRDDERSRNELADWLSRFRLAMSQLPDGADSSAAKRDVMDAVRAHFRPEFLNRLDETIIFDRLTRDDMDGIVTIQLRRLEKRLADRKITLDLDDGARKWLADEGYDPVFGARPLKRVIQNALQNQLAEMILAGEVKDGDTVHVSAGADGLIVGDRVSASNRPKPDDAVVH